MARKLLPFGLFGAGLLAMVLGGCMIPQGDTPLVPPGFAGPRAAPARPVDKVPQKVDPVEAAKPDVALGNNVRSEVAPGAPGVVTVPGGVDAPVSAIKPDGADLDPGMVGTPMMPPVSARASAPPLSAPATQTSPPPASEGLLTLAWPAEAPIIRARVLDDAGVAIWTLEGRGSAPVLLAPGRYGIEVELDGSWQRLGSAILVDAGALRAVVLAVEDGRARIDTSSTRALSPEDIPAGATRPVPEPPASVTVTPI